MMPTHAASSLKTLGAPSLPSAAANFCGKGGKPHTLVPIVVATALLAITCLPALPQTAPSASKPAPAPDSGLYRIAGKVVNAVTGEPVRRAIVAALAEADSPAAAPAVTDGDGHFELPGLPAAKYQLTASRRGYRTAFYDEHDEFSTAIVTGPGQDTGNLIFRLTPGSVLHGVITADGGDPVKDADVMIFSKPPGRRPGERIAEVDSTTTDDTGAYEFSNLAAGEYLLAVKAEPWYALHPSGNESRPRPANDPSAALDVVYPITYFDSTTDEAWAATIVLAGGNREEADFTLHAVPALHIALEAPGALAALNAAAMPTLRQTIFGAKSFTETIASPGNPQQETVEFGGVAPGHYELDLGDPPRVVDMDAAASQQVDTTLGAPTVAVSGTIQMPSGSMLTEEATVILDSLDPAHRQNPIQTTCTRGAFSFAAVPPGVWELWAGSSARMLPIASIAVGSRTHAGNRITVRDRPLTLVVSLSLGEMRVEGFARGSGIPGDAQRAPASSLGWRKGKGVAGVMVVLVPKNMAAWPALIRRDQSDSDGSFSLRDVVPGSYTMVAIEDGWNLDWARPEVIGRYLPGGIAVTVRDKSGKLVTLAEPVPVQSR